MASEGAHDATAAAALDRLAEDHQHRHLFNAYTGVAECDACGTDWPCDTALAVDLAKARVAVRDDVSAFADLMEQKLRKHDPEWGDGWKDAHPSDLWLLVNTHVQKLWDAMVVGDAAGVGWAAADVGNLAMMVAARTAALLASSPDAAAPNAPNWGARFDALNDDDE